MVLSGTVTKVLARSDPPNDILAASGRPDASRHSFRANALSANLPVGLRLALAPTTDPISLFGMLWRYLDNP